MPQQRRAQRNGACDRTLAGGGGSGGGARARQKGAELESLIDVEQVEYGVQRLLAQHLAELRLVEAHE
jgi:hypothetical protein